MKKKKGGSTLPRKKKGFRSAFKRLLAIICFGVTGSPLLFGFQLFAIIWNPDCI